MAYAIKYLFKFESSNGTTREVRVLQDGYTGEVIQRPLGRAPILKKQQNGPVHGTSLEFYAECNVDREFIEFYTSDPKAYRVDLYAGATLLWQGYITPELYSEPDIAPPYDVQVVATDGVGELKLYDYAAQGTVTLRTLLSGLLSRTGLGTDIYLISSLKAGSRGAGALLDMTINLDYMAGESCYDVLTYLLDTLHATITWWKGAWILTRETNVTFTSGKVRYFNTAGNSALLADSVQTLGSLRANPAWPVGQLSTVIDPAKNRVTVQAPWHVVTCLRNSDMGSDADWIKAKNARYETDGYVLPININTGTSETAVISQATSMAGLRVPMNLSVKATGATSEISAQVTGAVLGVLLTYKVGNVTYHLVKGDDGVPVWQQGSDIGTYIPLRTRIDFQQQLATWDSSRIEAEELSIDNIPPFLQGTTFPAGTLTVYILGYCAKIYGAYLDVVLPKGYQDILRIDNGARGEGSEVEIAIGRETTDNAYYAAFLQGLLLDSGNLITSFSDANFPGGMDYLAFIARDYALSVALPRAKVTGTVYLESGIAAPPLVFTKGALNYWLQTWSWNLYEDELELEGLTLPSASLTVESETILESNGSTVSSAGGAGSSGAGSSIGGGGTNYWEIDGTLNTLLKPKDAYVYVHSKDGLFFTGATLSGTVVPDLYVDTVNNQRVLRSPLPLITSGDQIVIDGTPGGGGGGGGATTLAGLDDTNISNPQPGQMLSWNGSKWVNTNAPTGSITSVSLAAGEANGTLHLVVNGTAQSDVAVTGLGSMAYKSSLAASDIPDLSATYQPKDADLTNIAALTGAGFLKRASNGTWSLDTNTYLTGITSTMVTNALGYTPADRVYVIYNPSESGVLVKTDLASTTAAMLEFIIEGNGYSGSTVVFSRVQAYNYPPENAMLSGKAINYGAGLSEFSVFNYGGYIYLWFQRLDTYQTFRVSCFTQNDRDNHVVEITSAGVPSGATRRLNITPDNAYTSANLTKSVLTTLLESDSGYYVKKSGDTMTGILTLNHTYANPSRMKFVDSRVTGTTGGWADSIISIHSADEALKASMGWYGAGATPEFVYFGFADYYGKNFRIYPDGTLALGNGTNGSTVSQKYDIYHQGNLTLATLAGNTAKGSTSLPIYYTGSALAPITDLDLLSQATGCVKANRVYLTSSIYFYTETVGGTVCVRLNAPFITAGDQIVISGTPGGGGGGGATTLAGLDDTSISNISNGQLLQWDSSARGGLGAWVNVAASSVGRIYSEGTGISISASNVISLNTTTAKTALGLGSMAYETAGDYVLKAGDTMSGHLKFSYAYSATNPAIISFINSRVSASGGTWIDTLIRFCDATATIKSVIGWYGSNATPTYLYIGDPAHNSANNLRIYSDRAAWGDNTILHAGNYTTWINSTNFPGLMGNQTITLSGDVSGSGATSITTTIGEGKVTNAMLAGSIANGKLANSSITIAGTAVSLGGSITAANLRSLLSISNVENTALSTWAGTTNITTLGNITTGVWHGSAIGNSYLANSSITINGSSTSLGGSFSTASITAGTAGQSTASSGVSFSIPYVTMNAYGIVTAYGTHTHTISAQNLYDTIGSTKYAPYHADGYLPLSGGTMSNTNVVTNLNADMLDGLHGDAFVRWYETTTTDFTSYFPTAQIVTKYGSTDGLSGDGAVMTIPTWTGNNTDNYYNVQFVFNLQPRTFTIRAIHSGSVDYTNTVYTTANANLSTVPWACSTLTASGNATIAGNVGIGTTSPGYTLDVRGPIQFLKDSGEVAVRFLTYPTSPYGILFRSIATGVWSMQVQRNSDNSETFGLALQPLGGNVGIGTASPSYTLDVNGGARARNLTLLWGASRLYFGCYGGVNYIQSGNADFTANANLVVCGPNTATGSDIQIKFSTATFSGTINSTGDQVVSSDATLKTNLTPVTYSVSDIAKARAVEFDWKDGRGHSMGSIAQDWLGIAPALVHGEEGNMSLAYGQLALVNTILLARQSESHEARIARLEKENAELKEEVKRLRMN